MRIYAIRNGRMDYSAQKLRTVKAAPQGAAPERVPCCDKVTFGNAKVAGAGIGAVVGLSGLALLSLLSGGLAAPAAFAAYAAMGGAIGGSLGSAVEKTKNCEF